MNLEERLEQGLRAWSFDLPENFAAQSLRYLRLLAKWNRAYNLTAVRDITDMLPRHVLDSLTVLPYVRGTRLLDIGSGAGLPGLVLALARPAWQIVLLDSNTKKTRFITQAVLELALPNVTVVSARAEAYRPETLFSTVLSRAFADLPSFYRCGAPLCGAGGCLLAMKGALPEAELQALQCLPARVQSVPLQVPGLDAQRHVVIIEPRRADA